MSRGCSRTPYLPDYLIIACEFFSFFSFFYNYSAHCLLVRGCVRIHTSVIYLYSTPVKEGFFLIFALPSLPPHQQLQLHSSIQSSARARISPTVQPTTPFFFAFCWWTYLLRASSLLCKGKERKKKYNHQSCPRTTNSPNLEKEEEEENQNRWNTSTSSPREHPQLQQQKPDKSYPRHQQLQHRPSSKSNNLPPKPPPPSPPSSAVALANSPTSANPNSGSCSSSPKPWPSPSPEPTPSPLSYAKKTGPYRPSNPSSITSSSISYILLLQSTNTVSANGSNSSTKTAGDISFWDSAMSKAIILRFWRIIIRRFSLRN